MIGLYVGRFQPIHEGHTNVIRKALEQCDKLIIAVGSAQEARTERNPLSYEERETLIRSVFCEEVKSGKIIIAGVPDREKPSNDSSWGVYLMHQVENKTGLKPNIIFEGAEIERSHWYDELNLKVCRINRGLLPISATKIREAVLNNDITKYKHCVPISIWWYYDDLRAILSEI